MASRIELLWRQALKTFSGQGSVNFKMCLRSFEKLKSLMDEITAEDVHVDKELLDHVKAQPAPMCVIDIYENQDITIAIFILKSGVKLPMHDHPDMHGLLKVISGIVQIDSFSIDPETDDGSRRSSQIPAVRHPSVIVKHTDSACVLTPVLRNLHEITCLEGPCAFLDVLSPPYDTGDFGEGKRPCTFYKVAAGLEKSENVYLTVTDVPPRFYSKSLKYMGQPLR
ncbi:hypothetical protein QAD02_020076 [Eretmocerus hayati]|uniref:Uncharacterized protein n=1 Tax=Eretmocerus hayati TaxID=131215 RepID=A0ACC2PLW7_9HYME|nr:hypothetical protein QAD02_020076 [Eretmocerus hayati]